MKAVILDDHQLFTKGIRQMLESIYKNIEITSFCSIKKIIESNFEFDSVDLLISDIGLPGEDVFDFFRNIRKSHSNLPILVISMHNKLSVIKKCKDLLIEGYILKDDATDLKLAIDSILSGNSYYSEKVTETYEILNIKSNILTPREEQVLESLSNGLSIEETSSKLAISSHTYKTHLKNIKRKLDISKTNELIVYYFKNYVT